MNQDIQALSPGFLISIAGINVKLSCEDLAVLYRLAARYEEFKGTDMPVMDVSVEIIGHESAGAFFDAEPQYVGERILFASKHYTGEINLHMGKAWLSVSSSQPVEEIEYFLRVVYAFLIFQAGGLLFHAAGIVRDRKAYLFFGYSGSGKTTVSRLSENDLILNDDLVVLLPGGDGWYAHATPFWNPTQVKPTPMNASIAGLYRLVQDTEVYIQKMGTGQSLAELVANAPVLSGSPLYSQELIDRCQKIISAVPTYSLHFLPDGTFWRVIIPPNQS
jgi:hypothetical protein